ncbi:MAG: succinate--CoA ligase subunit beta, partial [Bacteroidetes bacterium]|nr:succinate--CoA ligase subunit beta [Bacteroidota bacterium]
MNLHEYQSKIILKQHGVPVPEGGLANTPEEAIKVAEVLQSSTGTDKFVIKAQVHAGGRGKGGGVKIAKNFEEVRQYADQIIGMRLVTPQTSAEGKLVKKIYVEQNIFYPGPTEPREIYLSLLLNRKSGHIIIMYSPRGGMDIEKVAEETPDQIFTEEIDPRLGLQQYQARKVAFNLSLKGDAYKNMIRFLNAIYQAYIKS